ncbi:hypothetical protein BCR42DRAFT_391101 [Absidia repens]|uniref:Arrestin C-terminal-like domain-containing protein n=1 Tax=Absidia repens TaxID=90262 RepID=A0A1X2IML4_9FUNG|nr:hypothetical protein BCR42DRAFT_391101 [Absidia repens]
MEPSIKHKKSIVSDDENDLNGILNLWKRFTLKNDSPFADAYHHLFHPHHQLESIKKTKNMTIYLKSPYVLSGGTMEGTIALSPAPKKKIEQIELILHGIEIVFDPAHYSTSTHAHHFLNLPILTLQQPNDQLDEFTPDDTTTISFNFQMPPDLGSTFKDKKGCVQYTLQCHAKIQQDEENEDNEEIWFTDRPLHVYQSVQGLKSATDQASLYHAINERRRIWERRRSSRLSTSSNSNEASYADIIMNLSRSVWTSGSSIYVNMRMENKSVHKMRDVKLELIKRQNTYWQTGLHKAFDLMPVTSTCETVASTSLLNLASEIDRHFLCTSYINYIINKKNTKKLLFFVSTDAIIEIPITLVHPISADPPPGSISTSTPLKNNNVKSLPCSPSLPLFRNNHHHDNPTDDQTLILPRPSSTASSSIWSSKSLSYSPFLPVTTNSTTPPPPPLPPKQQHHLSTDPPEKNSPSIENSDNNLTIFESSSSPEKLLALDDHDYSNSSECHQKQHYYQTSASTLKQHDRILCGKSHSQSELTARKKKLTMVDACEALVHHTADKCKSAFFSSSWSSAIFHMKKRPLVQKLSSSFSSGFKSSSNATIIHPPPHSKQLPHALSSSATCTTDRNIISPSGTMLVVAPSQKFEISVQELDLLSPSPSSPAASSPVIPPPRRQQRRHKGLHRLWSLKRKRKSRKSMRSQAVKLSLD